METRFAPSIPIPRPLLILNAGYEAIRQYEEWCWPFHQIVCCCHGQGHIMVEGQKHPLFAGSICLIRPNTPHAYIVGAEPFHVSWVSFEGYLADRLPVDYGLPPDKRFSLAIDHRHPEIHLKIMSILEQVGDPFTVDGLISVLFDIFIHFLLLLQTSKSVQTGKQYEETVIRAVEWIKSHVYEPIDIQRFADDIGMSRQHLARLFRQKFPTTPREFYMRMKIQQAQQDLTEFPHLSVHEVANKLGFVNYSHFSRVFREIAGVSPGAFRRTFTSSNLR